MSLILRHFFEELSESSKFLFLALATVLLVLFIVFFADMQTYVIIHNDSSGYRFNFRFFVLTLGLIPLFLLISILLTIFSYSAKTNDFRLSFQNSLKITGFSTISLIPQSLIYIIAAFYEMPIIFVFGILFMVLSVVGIISYGYFIITKQSINDTIKTVIVTLFIAFIIEIGLFIFGLLILARYTTGSILVILNL